LKAQNTRPIKICKKIIKKFFGIRLDFSTPIFALILRVAYFWCKSVQFVVNLYQKVKTVQKVQKTINFCIFALLHLISYLYCTYVNL